MGLDPKEGPCARRRRMRVFFLALLLVVAGCHRQWVRPNTHQSEARQDEFSCTQEAAHALPHGNGFDRGGYIDSCMGARGYEWRR